MSDALLTALVPGRPVIVHVPGGGPFTGIVVAVDGPWLRLAASGGETLVRVDQITSVVLPVGVPAAESPTDEALPRPRSKDVPVRATSRVPGRPWADEDLREVAHAFLDGKADSELAERHHRTRHQITVLRQAHEALRGNLRDDQISEVAQGWIPRLRRVLGGDRG
jgi:hypothetical protein